MDSQKSMRHFSLSNSKDPIPIALIVAFIGAAAAIAYLGFAVGRAFGGRQCERRQREFAFGDALFAAYRDLKRLQHDLEEFGDFIKQYELTEEEIRLNRLPIDSHGLRQFRNLLRDIRQAGDGLGDELEEVRELLESDSDRNSVAKLVLKLDSLFRETTHCWDNYRPITL